MSPKGFRGFESLPLRHNKNRKADRRSGFFIGGVYKEKTRSVLYLKRDENSRSERGARLRAASEACRRAEHVRARTQRSNPSLSATSCGGGVLMHTRALGPYWPSRLRHSMATSSAFALTPSRLLKAGKWAPRLVSGINL